MQATQTMIPTPSMRHHDPELCARLDQLNYATPQPTNGEKAKAIESTRTTAEKGRRSYDALAMSHIETIVRHSRILKNHLIHYRDPAQLDPSNLDEIDHAVSELRRIAVAAAAEKTA